MDSISSLAVAMLLETELTRDQDRLGARMAPAVCSFGGTQGKSACEPLGLQPGQDNPQGEKWLGRQSLAEGQWGERDPGHSRERKKVEKHCGGRGAAPMGDGNRNGVGGTRVWQIPWTEGLEFPAMAPEDVGCCGPPREQKGTCRHCRGEGIGWTGGVSFLQRPHTPQLSHRAQQCRTGTPGLGLPPEPASPRAARSPWALENNGGIAGRPARC